MKTTPSRNRGWVRPLRYTGGTLGVLGALGVLVGAVLPWAVFEVFGTEFTLPGVAGWGGVCGALAVVVLTNRLFVRVPWLAIVVGLVSLYVAGQAQRLVGREVALRILAMKQALGPVNGRLAQVGLPPVEPFGPVGRWRDHVGKGTGWTFWGGTLLCVGGVVVVVSERVRRRCGSCGVQWDRDRADTLVYCPECGVQVGALRACPTCHAAVEAGDRFCGRCRENIPSPT